MFILYWHKKYRTLIQRPVQDHIKLFLGLTTRRGGGISYSYSPGVSPIA